MSRHSPKEIERCKRIASKMSIERPAESSFAAPAGYAADSTGRWLIEYEIPPLRAIYFAEAKNCTEAEAREYVRTELPLWRIRKVQRHNAAGEPQRRQPKT